MSQFVFIGRLHCGAGCAGRKCKNAPLNLAPPRT
jgi:hypothetical protein